MKEIPLSQNKVALVSDHRYDELNQYKWCTFQTPAGHWYAVRNTRTTDGKKRLVYMHRQIMAVTDPQSQVDHRDHNGLNNQDGNLRVCNVSQNHQNARKRKVATASQFKGVHWNNQRTKWQAEICIAGDGSPHYIGLFKSEVDAAHAYNEAAVTYFGEFACLNQLKQTQDQQKGGCS